MALVPSTSPKHREQSRLNLSMFATCLVEISIAEELENSYYEFSKV